MAHDTTTPSDARGATDEPVTLNVAATVPDVNTRLPVGYLEC